MSSLFRRLAAGQIDPAHPRVRPAAALPFAPLTPLAEPMDGAASAPAPQRVMPAATPPAPTTASPAARPFAPDTDLSAPERTPTLPLAAPTSDAGQTPRDPLPRPVTAPTPHLAPRLAPQLDPARTPPHDAPPRLTAPGAEATTRAATAPPDTASEADLPAPPPLVTLATPARSAALPGRAIAERLARPTAPADGDRAPVRPHAPAGAGRPVAGSVEATAQREAAEPNEVHVHIGRIEVTALPEPARPQRRRGQAPMSLDDYLKRRKEGTS